MKELRLIILCTIAVVLGSLSADLLSKAFKDEPPKILSGDFEIACIQHYSDGHAEVEACDPDTLKSKFLQMDNEN